MNRRDPASAPTALSLTVYDQALAAVIREVRDELAAAQNRLATPAELAPLQRRVAALESLRRR